MKAIEIIKSEMKRREDLINDKNFRKMAADFAKKMGVTADEWNNNKMPILLMIANKVCSFENQLMK